MSELSGGPMCGACGQPLAAFPVGTDTLRYGCRNQHCYPEARQVPVLLGYISQAESLAEDIAKACRMSGHGKHAREFYRVRSLLSEAQCVLMVAEEIEREGE